MNGLRKVLHSRAVMIAAAMLIVSVVSTDAAYACTARIGNFVWLDTNGDGVQDAGEPGIPGVTVELVRASDGVVLKTVTTDANGYYIFIGRRISPLDPPICEHTYIIRASTPAGLIATLIGVGSNDTDSNDPLGAFATPTDIPDFDGVAEDLTIDFGFVPERVCTATIGDLVWHDLNNNGQQDAGESGIAGNVVSLGGAASATTATNANGIYGFANLCAGTYTVCADTPTGFQPSPANVGSDDTDSDGTANGQGQSCTTVTLIGDSSSDKTIDFGFWKTRVTSPGTGTPGYWKNHPEAWPVETLTIGGVVYEKEQALEIMSRPDGDKTITIFRALVAAKLNVLIGNDSSCIASTISSADAWMSSYGPAGSGVKAKSVAWKAGEPLYWDLDAYNNGDRCAPHRD